jgi:hypothetical protein
MTTRKREKAGQALPLDLGQRTTAEGARLVALSQLDALRREVKRGRVLSPGKPLKRSRALLAVLKAHQEELGVIPTPLLELTATLAGVEAAENSIALARRLGRSLDRSGRPGLHALERARLGSRAQASASARKQLVLFSAWLETQRRALRTWEEHVHFDRRSTYGEAAKEAVRARWRGFLQAMDAPGSRALEEAAGLRALLFAIPEDLHGTGGLVQPLAQLESLLRESASHAEFAPDLTWT